jgi:CheY-like chemotaxis protein
MPDELCLSILVVEDEDDSAKSLAELLTLSGHTVRIAPSGPEALWAVWTTTPDVVLLDIGLPGMDGWEVARRLRVQCQDKQPLVVAVTGYETTEDKRRSADAGIDLHLIKPVEPAALTRLMSWVREVLNQQTKRTQPSGQPLTTA